MEERRVNINWKIMIVFLGFVFLLCSGDIYMEYIKLDTEKLKENQESLSTSYLASRNRFLYYSIEKIMHENHVDIVTQTAAYRY